MHTIKVSADGSVLIPKELRDQYGITPGIEVRIVDYSGVLAIVPVPEDPIDALHGLLRDGPSLTDDLLTEHAQEQAAGDGTE